MSEVYLNQLGVVKRNIRRADPAAVEKLSRFGSATIHEAMGRIGLMKPYMRHSRTKRPGSPGYVMTNLRIPGPSFTWPG